MSNEEIDRALSEGEIVPSSGFAESVMEAVRSEAAAPAPIPFPWKWAVPGLIAWVAVIAVAVAALRHAAPGDTATLVLSPGLVKACEGAVAIAMALGCVRIAMRLAGARS